MKINQAKEFCDQNILAGLDAVRAPRVPGHWLLVVNGQSGQVWTLQADIGGPL